MKIGRPNGTQFLVEAHLATCSGRRSTVAIWGHCEIMLPPRLFKSSVVTIGFCMIGVTAMVLIGVTIFLPLYLQVVADASVSSSGLLLLPLVGGVTAGSVIGGRLVSHTGRYKIFPIVGLATAAVALAMRDAAPARNADHRRFDVPRERRYDDDRSSFPAERRALSAQH